MNITKPNTLCRSSNRNITARVNARTGGPEQWFTVSNLQRLGYDGMSFDFFINWQTQRFVKALWFKRFIDIDIARLTTQDNWQQSVISELQQAEGTKQLRHVQDFCTAVALRPYYLLFNDTQWNHVDSLDQTKLIYIQLSLTDDNHRVKVINLEVLKQKILKGTGRKFNMQKELLYSTSHLEYILSQTDTPYPGDADMVITNEAIDDFIIIEFKKHNLSTPIENQCLSNYYPAKDRSKYERLNKLRQRLAYFGQARLYTLYYSTDSSETNSKLELNAYSDQHLGEWHSCILPTPTSRDDEQDINRYLHACLTFFKGNEVA